ncbi:MAG: hypothetical protein P1V18_00205 [Candidatus Gracilibacteria bacterium]|nr:hypothetical protein [Candidatus Gracilibacteria bacterium]
MQPYYLSTIVLDGFPEQNKLKNTKSSQLKKQRSHIINLSNNIKRRLSDCLKTKPTEKDRSIFRTLKKDIQKSSIRLSAAKKSLNVCQQKIQSACHQIENKLNKAVSELEESLRVYRNNYLSAPHTSLRNQESLSDEEFYSEVTAEVIKNSVIVRLLMGTNNQKSGDKKIEKQKLQRDVLTSQLKKSQQRLNFDKKLLSLKKKCDDFQKKYNSLIHDYKKLEEKITSYQKEKDLLVRGGAKVNEIRTLIETILSSRNTKRKKSKRVPSPVDSDAPLDSAKSSSDEAFHKALQNTLQKPEVMDAVSLKGLKILYIVDGRENINRTCIAAMKNAGAEVRRIHPSRRKLHYGLYDIVVIHPGALSHSDSGYHRKESSNSVLLPLSTGAGSIVKEILQQYKRSGRFKTE